MCNIDRFKKVNIEATNAAQVLDSNDNPAHTSFLSKCISDIKKVQFADTKTTEVYATFDRPDWATGVQFSGNPVAQISAPSRMKLRDVKWETSIDDFFLIALYSPMCSVYARVETAGIQNTIFVIASLDI